MKHHELRDRVAIVTGAASGIGAAVSVLLASEGASVVLVDKRAEGLEATAAQIEANRQRSAIVVGDVTVPETASRAVDAANECFGGIHILVNNAGIARVGSVVETTEAEWDLIFASNVRSAYLASRAVIPPMQKANGGSIVTIASEAGLVGFSRYAAYSASKAALIGLTRAMAIDHAPDHIRVNCVCPGSIETPLLIKFYEAQEDPAAARAQDEADHPLGIGTAEDIAQAVLYLVSDRSAYVTGHALVVDGGYTTK